MQFRVKPVNAGLFFADLPKAGNDSPSIRRLLSVEGSPQIREGALVLMGVATAWPRRPGPGRERVFERPEDVSPRRPRVPP